MEASRTDAHDLDLVTDGCTSRVTRAHGDAELYFRLDGIEHVATDTTYAAVENDRLGNASGSVTAPMNGQVVALHVEPGASVKAGQVLLVIEAMKMEHSVLARMDGRLTSLLVGVGEQVAPGCLLAEIAGEG